MADKSINVTMTGPEAVIDASLNAFVRQNGYTDTVRDPVSGIIPNPLTQEQYSERILLRNFANSVSVYNLKLAKAAVDITVKNQVNSDISQIDIKVTVGDK